MSQGWVKQYRDELESDLWQDVTTYRLYTVLKIMASHKDGVKVNGFELKKGQYIRSYSKLAEDLTYKEGRGYKKVSKSTIKRSVEKLIKSELITISETEYGTLFTVVQRQENQGFEHGGESINETVKEPLVERTQNEPETKTIIKELKNAKEKIPYVEIINYLNERAGTKFSSKSETNKKLINARFAEGRTLEDFKHVIDIKCNQWLNNQEMKKYLRPSTLFSPKHFENYVNEENNRTQPNQKNQKLDPRDIEIAFNKWVTAGGNPDDFDWKTGKGITHRR